MGGLFVLNDSEQNIYWKKNLFKIESFILYESTLLLFLSFISYISFPFDSLRLIRQKLSLDSMILYVFGFSIFDLMFSLLIKKVHINNRIKPNYRLCLMNFYATMGFFFFFASFFLCLYISLTLIEWESLTGIILYNRSLVTKRNENKTYLVSLGKAIYTILWNYLNLLCSLFGFVDYAIEIINVSRAAKVLSEGNNINNKNLLYELFRIPINNDRINDLEKNNTLDNVKNINKRENFTKLRLVMSNNGKEENSFENENNKFREVEVIQKVEYNSIAIQTEDINESFYNNYINDSNNKIIDEDLSNNFILVKNKPLIDSKISLN